MSNLDDFFNVKPVVQEQQTFVTTEFRPNPKKGQNGVYKAVVRFLPNPVDPANKSIISKYIIYLQNPATQNSMSVDCPSTIGQPDPLQNTFFALRNSANPILQENSKKFSRKQQFASLIQVISCESDPSLVNKILVWKYGTKIHDKLNVEMTPPMPGAQAKNPFNLLTGRPFSVQVKEVGGFPNYDACGFFDMDVVQSGMRIITNNAQGQPQPYIVTPEIIATPEGKQLVFNYLKENAPDTTKYEYQPWTAETTTFVNECIQIYSNPQATVQAMSAASNPGVGMIQSQPMQAQAAAQPTVTAMPTMPSMPSMPTMPTAPANTFSGPVPQPSMPFEMPSMDLGAAQAAPTTPGGFQAPSLSPDVDALINDTSEKKPAAAPSMGLDLADVLNGQMI